MARGTSLPFKGTPEQEKELRAWLAENRGMKGAALPALQKAQESYGYLPIEVQRIVAEELEMPLEERWSGGPCCPIHVRSGEEERHETAS